MNSLVEPQPAPVAVVASPALWDLVIADIADGDSLSDALICDMRARDEFGFAKYGTHLQAHNGRDALVDAYQESLDLCVYLKQWLVEKPSKVHADTYWHYALPMVRRLRYAIAQRDK